MVILMYQVEQVKQVVGMTSDEITVFGLLIGIIILLLLGIRWLLVRIDKTIDAHNKEKESWNEERKEYSDKLEQIIEKHSVLLTRFVDINKMKE